MLHVPQTPVRTTFGPALESELDELVRIHTAAFPGGRGGDARIANFRDNSRGGYERLFVLREHGHPVAHAFLFRLETAIAGELLPFGGIATVGVAPEHRGRGLGGVLLAELHAQAASEQLAGTFLYAFRQGFYRRFGYGRTSLRAVVDLHPASLTPSPHRAVVRLARGHEDFDRLARVQREAVLRGTLGHVRSVETWARLRRVFGREWMLIERDGDTVGYLWADRVCIEDHAPITLDIGELVTLDQDAEAAIFRWISTQKDQVQRVVCELPLADVESLDLVDPDRHRSGTVAIEHPLGTMALGPMVRVGNDAGAFLARRRWPRSGAVTVAACSENGARLGAWSLVVEAGRASVQALDADAAVAIEAPVTDLASLVAGGVSLRDLRRIRTGPHGDLDLEAFFALPPARPSDAF